MVPSNFGYSLRECGHHFRRNWTTVLGAVVTIFLSLFIIGLFVIASAMINNMVGSVEDRVTIQAFLSDDADQATVNSFQEDIASWDNVESVTYKSKDEALEDYQTSMSNRNASDALAALDSENPLPASLVIKLTDPQQVESTAQKIAQSSTFQKICDQSDNPAGDVKYGQETVEKLFSVTNYLRIGAIVLVALLTFVAFVFINNTIRLAITARRREIGIMRLVGASNGFIRGPFIMEGTLEAVIGALLAIVVLFVGVNALLPALSSSMAFLAFDVSSMTLYATFGLLLLLGVLIGFFGSAIAMRRYLKV
ncbi:ABC transporter permease [Thermophilibacter immobilis]|jgi:cell division transport system permease protein|uniref:Cell division protein FtsX n=2 Tax=Thermophilibacter immobilis TaxID=2779519 RepID=A0A7S7MBQ8_9ACTN|nr:permease-like cell division protein FtsX [Thermophilibacter immobilis]QOY61508.1 ABC transporter permease [Thermophilibacter immobilis]